MNTEAAFYFLLLLNMHYCVYVFIPKEGDVEELVAIAMQPYSEDAEVAPYKIYPDADEIAAMGKHYRLAPANLTALAAKMEDWKGGPGGVDARGLFVIQRWNPSGKWDWYEIGGRWPGWIRGNVTSTATLLRKRNLKRILPACMVTPDGWWHERETFVSQGWMKWRIERKKDGAWLRQVIEALAKYPDHRVVCVDKHS